MVNIGSHVIGPGERVFVIAEIGINHNGSLDLARKLIDVAAVCGCDAVKFQKRTPELCVPRDQWAIKRDTPWGRMAYIDYRQRIELSKEDYEAIDRDCRDRSILWFASCWDEPSVAFMAQFDPPCYKSASAALNDLELLAAMKRTRRPLIISTGMSTMDDVDAAVSAMGDDDLCIAHAISAYPCPVDQLNLRVVRTLAARYPRCPIGYSGHETGVAPTLAAVALGATFVERHVTLDRAMWGTDQAASIEPAVLAQLVADIRTLDLALGDGVKRVTVGELGQVSKLRRKVSVRPS